MSPYEYAVNHSNSKFWFVDRLGPDGWVTIHDINGPGQPRERRVKKRELAVDAVKRMLDTDPTDILRIRDQWGGVIWETPPKDAT